MKAQISSQVFIYIMAALIAGTILLVGFKAIQTIMAQGEEIRTDELQSDIRTFVSRTYRDWGSRRKLELSLPRRYDEICFASSMQNNAFDVVVPDEYPLIQNSIQSDVRANVFLLSDNKIEDSFYVENLAVGETLPHFHCFENTGSPIVLWMDGTGEEAVLDV